jgi:hypothetical protein
MGMSLEVSFDFHVSLGFYEVDADCASQMIQALYKVHAES